MDSDENNVNVSLTARDKVTKTVSINHTLFEEKGIELRPFCLQPNASPLGHTGWRLSAQPGEEAMYGNNYRLLERRLGCTAEVTSPVVIPHLIASHHEQT